MARTEATDNMARTEATVNMARTKETVNMARTEATKNMARTEARDYMTKNLVSVLIGTYQRSTIFDSPKKWQNHSPLVPSDARTVSLLDRVSSDVRTVSLLDRVPSDVITVSLLCQRFSIYKAALSLVTGKLKIRIVVARSCCSRRFSVDLRVRISD